MTKFVNAARALQVKMAVAKLRREEEGQGMVEYGLILVLVSLVAIGALTIMGGEVNNAFTEAGNTLQTR